MEDDFLAADVPERELIELILKYRDAVQQEQYLPVSQREADRERLNVIYARLETIRQKILDSRCYLELGKLQRELGSKFLADDTSPCQRLQMLAYLVRCVCYPVVFVNGRNTISKLRPARDTVDVIEAEPDEPPEKQTPKFRSYDISAEDLRRMQQEIRDLLDEYPRRRQWQKRLSVTQAEILSQMAASGEIEIACEGKAKGVDGVAASIVLKECP